MKANDQLEPTVFVILGGWGPDQAETYTGHGLPKMGTDQGDQQSNLSPRQNGMANAREYLSTYTTGESMIEMNSLAAHQHI